MAVSTRFKRSAFAGETSDVWLVLATISHSQLSSDINLVNNTSDIVSNGTTYRRCPFEIILPDETDDGTPIAEFRIDNVDQRLSEAFREINTAATIRLRVILSSAPNTVEVDYGNLSLKDVRIDRTQAVGRIGLPSVDEEPFPNRSFSPTYFSGLF